MSNKVVLEIKDLYKGFGAVQATNNVSFDLIHGEVHAIIGPNGAGKSTLITQISGEIQPDKGTIHLLGQNITTRRAYERARLGLGRSFQITELCPQYTALENVILSCMLRSGKAFGVWSNPRHNQSLRTQALDYLALVGLADRGAVLCSDMAHGEKRQLELAVALARHPKVLLLDEPMAGMGAEESRIMTKLLLELKKDYGILLVEHDMDAVFALADRISVLVYGAIIFTGTPDEVRSNQQVRAAYLGED